MTAGRGSRRRERGGDLVAIDHGAEAPPHPVEHRRRQQPPLLIPPSHVHPDSPLQCPYADISTRKTMLVSLSQYTTVYPRTRISPAGPPSRPAPPSTLPARSEDSRPLRTAGAPRSRPPARFRTCPRATAAAMHGIVIHVRIGKNGTWVYRRVHVSASRMSASHSGLLRSCMFDLSTYTPRLFQSVGRFRVQSNCLE